MNPPDQKKHPLSLLLFILIPVLIAGAVFLALRGSKQWPIEEVDQGVVETYCRLIAEGRFGDAYDQCLVAAYRREVSLEEFARAHEQTRAERGVLQSREILREWSTVNLFTRVRDVRILYLLTYPEGEWREYVVVDNADGEWRIEGTYRRAVKHLEFVIW